MNRISSYHHTFCHIHINIYVLIQLQYILSASLPFYTIVKFLTLIIPAVSVILSVSFFLTWTSAAGLDSFPAPTASFIYRHKFTSQIQSCQHHNDSRLPPCRNEVRKHSHAVNPLPKACKCWCCARCTIICIRKGARVGHLNILKAEPATDSASFGVICVSHVCRSRDRNRWNRTTDTLDISQLLYH